MKPFYLSLLFFTMLELALCEPAVGKYSPYSYNTPSKNGKQLALNRSPNNGQKTLVVQIRSDQPERLILKGRPNMALTHAHQSLGHGHSHAHPHHLSHSHVHHHINAATTNLRGHQRPIKLTAPAVYLKNPAFLRKPLKFKLNNSKTKLISVHKPATSYDAPFKYEKPAYASSELQQLPLEPHVNFISEHFAPIHTIPAPNLSLQSNHIEETYLPPSSPKPQVYHQKKNNYQVVEDNTNDQTFVDPLSGSQKLIAPDPDPSLPAAPVRPAKESFNQPSNGKPLPVDVQGNHLPAAQPLVQIVGAHAAQQIAPEIYPIQYTQSFLQTQPIPIYNPTYLVQQSNNLYTQHQQQLFKPAVAAVPILEAGYVNADLTQQVASNGQILQAAKDPHNNIHPILDIAPHFAPLIAAPSLDQEQSIETAPFRLQNIAGSPATTESGFVVSNYYGNADSSQLLQAYAEEEQAEAERQQQYQVLQRHQQQIQDQQQQQQLIQQQQQQLEQQHQQQQLDQQQQQLELEQLQQFHQQHQQFQQQQHQYDSQQQQQPQQQRLVQQQQQTHNVDPSSDAFEEHKRLVQQQLGSDTPLRIFVPDEEEARLQKRSDDIVKGSFEDVDNKEGVEDEQPHDDELYEVSSSVEVSNEDQQQQNQNSSSNIEQNK